MENKTRDVRSTIVALAGQMLNVFSVWWCASEGHPTISALGFPSIIFFPELGQDTTMTHLGRWTTHICLRKNDHHASDASLTEDSGSLIAPIVLRDLPEGQTPLQEVIQQWHHHGPWLNGLRTANSWVCLQLERHPRLHHRHCQAITWERNRIQLPVFDGYNHCSITWTEYQIVAGVLHIGNIPVEGHYCTRPFCSTPEPASCVMTAAGPDASLVIGPFMRISTWSGRPQWLHFAQNIDDHYHGLQQTHSAVSSLST